MEAKLKELGLASFTLVGAPDTLTLSIRDSDAKKSVQVILANFPAVVAVDLSFTNIGDAHITELVEALKTNPFIKELDLSMNRLSGFGFATLGSALPATHIHTLILRNNHIDNDGVRRFVSFIADQPDVLLKRIDLSSNHIGDEGVAELSKLLTEPTKTSLTHLDISFNRFGVIGITSLASAVRHSTSLHHLSVRAAPLAQLSVLPFFATPFS
eukprot:c10064_g2_i3.p2 GENE.c10064_g2_i3~~c10064_g2_i3.p2  ORF type:complete len:213 (+),score=49.54 c10064_g2_i3:31-669(+)